MKEKEAVKRINQEIKWAVDDFRNGGHDELYQRNVAKINGMIEILQIYTGKDYQITENGLIER